MAISIDWATRVISIPQSFLTLISGVRYSLDVEDLRLALKDIEDGEDGMSFDDTHTRNAPVTLGGVTYAQTFEIINGYTVEFENTGTPYTVVVTGGNHNLGDVTTFDGGCSLVIGNSAGLIVVETGISGLTTAEAAMLEEIHLIHGLKSGSPLAVTATTRAAGAINQAITNDGTTATVTRT